MVFSIPSPDPCCSLCLVEFNLILFILSGVPGLEGHVGLGERRSCRPLATELGQTLAFGNEPSTHVRSFVPVDRFLVVLVRCAHQQRRLQDVSLPDDQCPG